MTPLAARSVVDAAERDLLARRASVLDEDTRGSDHEFHIVTSEDDRPPVLVHVLDAQLHGLGRLSWPLVYGPLHDALLEDALDNAERACTAGRAKPAVWSPHVRRVRRLLARRAGPVARTQAWLARG